MLELQWHWENECWHKKVENPEAESAKAEETRTRQGHRKPIHPNWVSQKVFSRLRHNQEHVLSTTIF
jgi:hypothetical protein